MHVTCVSVTNVIKLNIGLFKVSLLYKSVDVVGLDSQVRCQVKTRQRRIPGSLGENRT